VSLSAVGLAWMLDCSVWHEFTYYLDCVNLFIFLALCDLPCGDEVSHELTDAEVTTLRLETYYADRQTGNPKLHGEDSS